jgi:hypothetical protein
MPDHALLRAGSRRAGAPFRETPRKSPFVTMCFVDSRYNGDEAQRAAFETSRISVTVVQRNDKQIKTSSCCPSAGSTDGHSAGSTEPAASPKTLRQSLSPRSHGSSSPSCSCSHDASQGSRVSRQNEIRVRLFATQAKAAQVASQHRPI